MTFNHTKHKELWTWLSENPGKLQADWPGWTENRPRNLCFVCEAIRLAALAVANLPLREIEGMEVI